MATEVEAKFLAESTDPLDELAVRAKLGGALLGHPRTVDETDRYLDTADGRLEAARWACRLRTRDGVTRISLKGPAGDGTAGWYHRRPEVEGPATAAIDPGSWPPSVALELLDVLRAGQPLVERVRLEQQRTERSVMLDDGTSIGTLTLDHVRVLADRDDLGRLFVVELELDPTSERAASQLDELAAELAMTAGLVSEPRTKLEHALQRMLERR